MLKSGIEYLAFFPIFSPLFFFYYFFYFSNCFLNAPGRSTSQTQESRTSTTLWLKSPDGPNLKSWRTWKVRGFFLIDGSSWLTSSTLLFVLPVVYVILWYENKCPDFLSPFSIFQSWSKQRRMGKSFLFIPRLLSTSAPCIINDTFATYLLWLWLPHPPFPITNSRFWQWLSFPCSPPKQRGCDFTCRGLISERRRRSLPAPRPLLQCKQITRPLWRP